MPEQDEMADGDSEPAEPETEAEILLTPDRWKVTATDTRDTGKYEDFRNHASLEGSVEGMALARSPEAVEAELEEWADVVRSRAIHSGAARIERGHPDEEVEDDE